MDIIPRIRVLVKSQVLHIAFKLFHRWLSLSHFVFNNQIWSDISLKNIFKPPLSFFSYKMVLYNSHCHNIVSSFKMALYNTTYIDLKSCSSFFWLDDFMSAYKWSSHTYSPDQTSYCFLFDMI